MDKIGREELKKDYPDIIKGIQKRHNMHPDVPVELFERNKPVKGLAHTRNYFIILAERDAPDIYIQYSMRYQIMDPQLQLIGRAVDELIIYESFQEFEGARVRALSGSSSSDGLNFN